MRTCLVGSTSAMVALTSMAVAASAQTAPAPGASPAAPGASGTAGGIGEYWWLIVLAVLGAAAIWYFQRGRTGPRL